MLSANLTSAKRNHLMSLEGIGLIAVLILAISCNVVAEEGNTGGNNDDHQPIANESNPEDRGGGTAGNSDARGEKQRGSNPAIRGNPGGECDHGPTSISAEPEVNLVAHPGTSLHYSTVPQLNLAARLNRDDTEACFYSTGEPPVYYTLHIRSVDELRTYGALAEEGGYDQFTLDMIKATEIVKAAPTPTPRPCFFEETILRGKSYLEFVMRPSPCRPGESTGTIRRTIPDGWIVGTEVPCPTHASRDARCALASPPPTPTSLPTPTPTPAPRMCATEWATLRGPEGELYFEWVPKARLCEPHEPTGSVKKQDVPEEVFELFGTPHPWER